MTALLSTLAAPNWSTSPDASIARILEVARQHMGMELAFVGRFTSETELIEAVAGPIQNFGLEVGAGLPLGETYCIRMTDGRIAGIVPDSTGMDELKNLGMTTHAGVAAYIGVPIRFTDGSLYGTLCCVNRTPSSEMVEYDLKFMNALAALAATEVEARVFADSDTADRRQRLETILRERRIQPVFQPIVNIGGMVVIGVEALSRFEMEPIRSPHLWFADAWRLGLGVELELAAAKAAISQVDGLDPRIFLSINLSAASLVRPEFDQMVANIPPDRVLVEVTEHDVVDDYDALKLVRERLRERGIGLAIDDAGAGFASLKHIIRLIPDCIKLDTFLCRDIDRDPVKRALASSIVAFAAEIDARLIAEGVETGSELDTLLELGFTRGQGYLLGRPGAISDIGLPVTPTPAHFQTAVELHDRGDPIRALGAGERLRAVFEMSPEAILVIEGDATIRAWNPAAEELFGWTRREALGRSVMELVVPERYRQELADWLRQNRDRQTPGVVIQAPAVHRDGHEVEIELSISPGWGSGAGTTFIVFARLAHSHISERRP